MNTFKKTLIATAVTLASGMANATPYFDTGTNSIYYNNLENQYRSDEVCRITNGIGCLGSGTGPTGWQLVDPSIAGNIAIGDVFAGVIRVQNIDYATGSWTSSSTDQFTGYFAQQVNGFAGTSTATEIQFANPTSDPFGILGVGEMFRLYTQSGAGTTDFNDQTGGTVAGIISKATDGIFWASLGLTIDPDGSYGYSVTDFTRAGTDTNSKTEAFLSLNFVAYGGSYNAGMLNLINDKNESLYGGTTAKLVCNNGDILSSAICAQFVATSEIELNQFSSAYGDGVSPFIYASNDPAVISRIPEPGSLALMGLGLFGLVSLRRRKS